MSHTRGALLRTAELQHFGSTHGALRQHSRSRESTVAARALVEQQERGGRSSASRGLGQLCVCPEMLPHPALLPRQGVMLPRPGASAPARASKLRPTWTRNPLPLLASPPLVGASMLRAVLCCSHMMQPRTHLAHHTPPVPRPRRHPPTRHRLCQTDNTPCRSTTEHAGARAERRCTRFRFPNVAFTRSFQSHSVPPPTNRLLHLHDCGALALAGRPGFEGDACAFCKMRRPDHNRMAFDGARPRTSPITVQH